VVVVDWRPLVVDEEVVDVDVVELVSVVPEVVVLASTPVASVVEPRYVARASPPKAAVPIDPATAAPIVRCDSLRRARSRSLGVWRDGAFMAAASRRRPFARVTTPRLPTGPGG
jgi:hypothetical protein